MITTTQITEYSATEAGLAELRTKYANTVFAVTTTAGMEAAKVARREVLKLRTGLEAKRKEIKAPALEHCQRIDTEAKRITAELLKLETPIDEQIKAEEARLEAVREAKRKAEAERIAALQLKVDAIRAYPFLALGKPAEAIYRAYATARDLVITADEFQEFFSAAETAKAEAQAKLTEMHEAAILALEVAEKAAKEKAEREAAEALRAAELAAQATALAQERAALAEAVARQQAQAAAEQAEREECWRIDQEKLAAQQAAIAKAQAEAQAQIDAQNAALQAERERLEVLRVVEETASFSEAAWIGLKPDDSTARAAVSVTVSALEVKRARPSDAEIIDVLTNHYRVHEAVVVGWLVDLDVDAMAQSLREEFAEPRAQMLAAIGGNSYLELVAGAGFEPQLRRVRIA